MQLIYNIYKFIIIIISLIILLKNEFLIKAILFIRIIIYKKIYKSYLINVDSKGIDNSFGPGNFIKGINQFLPFFWKKCIFSSFDFNISFIDFYYIIFPRFNEKNYKTLVNTKLIEKYIIGPTFVPVKWNKFPQRKIWKEKRFSEILNNVKGLVVHSNRVINHLARRSNTTKYKNKFILVRACTNLKLPSTINFHERKIDIILYEKYADSNYKNEAKILFSELNKKKIIVKLKYKGYTKNQMIEIARNSKFIIYFSFYDTGAIGLKEIQNLGVLAFTHQEDLIISNSTTFYIPELAIKNQIYLAAQKINEIIDIFEKRNPDLTLIAKINQNINSCENALKDLCQSL